MDWIHQTKPVGTTQNEYVKELLRYSIEEPHQPSLFSQPKTTSVRIFRGKMHFNFIDLFAGIGGFRSALTALGGECVFTSEWDKYSVKTYREWYGDDEIYTDDIRNVSPDSDIPDLSLIHI